MRSPRRPRPGAAKAQGRARHGGRDLPRLRVRQPRPDLRARREAAADPPRALRALPRARRRPGRAPGCRLRRRDGRRRPGRAGQRRVAPSRRRSRRGRGPAASVRVVRARVRPPGGPPTRGTRHLRQQPPGPRHRRGGRLRGPGRLPRRTRRLAGPRLRRRTRSTCPSPRSGWSARTRCTSPCATSSATSGTGRGSPSPARADPAGRRDRSQPVAAATRPSSTARRSAA